MELLSPYTESLWFTFMNLFLSTSNIFQMGFAKFTKVKCLERSLRCFVRYQLYFSCVDSRFRKHIFCEDSFDLHSLALYCHFIQYRQIVNGVSCMLAIPNAQVQCISFISWYNMVLYWKRRNIQIYSINLSLHTVCGSTEHFTFHYGTKAIQQLEVFDGCFFFFFGFFYCFFFFF